MELFMTLNGRDFQVLDALDSAAISTQRQLSDHTGISLGQINYVLRRLLEKGLVKIGNFKKNPNKFGYIYTLTPQGIEARSRLAVSFVVRRLGEYHSLKARLAVRLRQLGQQGIGRVVFVGPAVVGQFIETIIAADGLPLTLVLHLTRAGELASLSPSVYDMALVFDADAESLEAIAAETATPREKLTMLW